MRVVEGVLEMATVGVIVMCIGVVGGVLVRVAVVDGVLAGVVRRWVSDHWSSSRLSRRAATMVRSGRVLMRAEGEGGAPELEASRRDSSDAIRIEGHLPPEELTTD